MDIASGWWQGWPVLDGTEQQACDALDLIRQHLPFRIREIHPDNDSAFLNYLLQGYCQPLQIALSRSRPLKKNDNCWVEEKNWTHVRKLVGYHRLPATSSMSCCAGYTSFGPTGRTSSNQSFVTGRKRASTAAFSAAMISSALRISGCGHRASSAALLLNR